ncbi:unnamed protein product [Camellia sinensis]
MPRKFEFHEHPLALFNRTTFRCNRCSCGNCNAMLRCVLYGFNIHIHCVPILPDTIMGRRHRHQLTLTYSPIRDHPDEDEAAELYCDDCKKLRYLIDPTYYCKECHYVAHVECMISKKSLPTTEEEVEMEEVTIKGVVEAAVPEEVTACSNKNAIVEAVQQLLSEKSQLWLANMETWVLKAQSEVVKEDLNKHGMEKKEAIHQESDIGELISLAELDKEMESLTEKLEALKQKRACYTSK